MVSQTEDVQGESVGTVPVHVGASERSDARVCVGGAVEAIYPGEEHYRSGHVMGWSQNTCEIDFNFLHRDDPCAPSVVGVPWCSVRGDPSPVDLGSAENRKSLPVRVGDRVTATYPPGGVFEGGPVEGGIVNGVSDAVCVIEFDREADEESGPKIVGVPWAHVRSIELSPAHEEPAQHNSPPVATREAVAERAEHNTGSVSSEAVPVDTDKNGFCVKVEPGMRVSAAFPGDGDYADCLTLAVTPYGAFVRVCDPAEHPDQTTVFGCPWDSLTACVELPPGADDGGDREPCEAPQELPPADDATVAETPEPEAIADALEREPSSGLGAAIDMLSRFPVTVKPLHLAQCDGNGLGDLVGHVIADTALQYFGKFPVDRQADALLAMLRELHPEWVQWKTG